MLVKLLRWLVTANNESLALARTEAGNADKWEDYAAVLEKDKEALEKENASLRAAALAFAVNAPGVLAATGAVAAAPGIAIGILPAAPALPSGNAAAAVPGIPASLGSTLLGVNVAGNPIPVQAQAHANLAVNIHVGNTTTTNHHNNGGSPPSNSSYQFACKVARRDNDSDSN